MILQNHSRLVLLFATCLFFMGSLSQANATPRLRGDVYVHDPSTVVECDGRHYVFYTRRNIGINHSDDGIHWISAGQVFNQPPSWTYEAVPEFGGSFWAPDIIYSGGRYCLYYSVSSWGSQVSAIGLVTNVTLNPDDPDYQWIDRGPVIQSHVGSPYNCIDPSLLLTDEGELWMAFGSYWNGIYLVQLDPETAYASRLILLSHV